MGRMLAATGYHVVHKGKWHMTMTDDNEIPSSEDVAGYGFDDWEPTAVADYTLQDNFGGGCVDRDNNITGQALKFLSAETTTQQPFTLIVGLGNPHDVLSCPTSWNQPNPNEDPSCLNYADFDFKQGIDIPLSAYADDIKGESCQIRRKWKPAS